MKPEIIGYIVHSRDGVYRLASETSTDNVGGVWFVAGGQSVTLFPTRTQARRAIQVAMRYSKSKGYAWHTWLKHAAIYPVSRA